MTQPAAFSVEDAERIGVDVRWGERQRATATPPHRTMPQSTTGAYSGISWAIARQRDPDGTGESIIVVPLVRDNEGMHGFKIPTKPNPIDPDGEPVAVTDIYRCRPGTKVRNYASMAQPTGTELKERTTILPVFWSLGEPFLMQDPLWAFPWPNETFETRGCKPVVA